MIIEWPPNGQFHDARDIILTSQMAIREMVVNIGNVVNMIYIVGRPLEVIIITFTNTLEKFLSELVAAIHDR